MPRFKLTIEYAGTRYSGWQIQQNARTVQGEIDRAVREVTGRKDFELYGSGRTDAGVHALAQVAHLDVAGNIPADTLCRRLNDELPSDINILSVEPATRRFHARHDAVARRYVYQVARRRTAFAKSYVWWVKDPLDVERMRAAAAAFVGMRDFQSFSASSLASAGGPPEDSESAPAAPMDVRRSVRASGGGAPRAMNDEGPDKSTLVLIDRLEILEDGDFVLFSIEGSHFLWKMVRRIVGVLVEIGRGALEVGAAARFLADKSSAPARFTAPPSGLFLERVFYDDDARRSGIQSGPKLTPRINRTTSA